MTSEDAETDAIAILAATLFPCLSRYRVMYLRKESIPLGRVRSEIGTHPVRYDLVRISSWVGKLMCVLFFWPVVRVDRRQHAARAGLWSLQ